MFRQQVKYRLVYNRRNKFNKDGKALIQIETYLGKKKRYFSTGIYIYPEEWDDKRKLVKTTVEYNWRLFELQKEMQKFENKMIEEYGYFDLSMFDEFFAKQNSVAEDDFFGQFEKYYEMQNVSKSRKMYIKRTIKYWKELNSKITLRTFNLQTILEYDYFLRTEKGLHTNSILQHHKITKHFLNQLKRSGIIDRNEYDNFKIKREKTERIYLTESEIDRIKDVQTEPNRRYTAVKDMFLFSCYTGLRFSDIRSLKPVNIERDGDDVNIVKKQEKTGDTVHLPISVLFDGKALEILDKYYDESKGFIFPAITNQAANRILKSLQMSAGIQKELTFHVARHTFGTLLAKYTHDPYLIKELMGHSDIRTSMTYIHLSQQMMKERLKKVKWSDD